MPYTLNGRWFPDAWFEEMGIPVPLIIDDHFQRAPQRSYHDVSDQDIIEGWNQYYLDLAEREERERLAAEAAAEAARIAEEARLEEERRNRRPAFDVVREAFQNTLFTVSSAPVYRNMVVRVDRRLEPVPREVGEIFAGDDFAEDNPIGIDLPQTVEREVPVYEMRVVPGYQHIVNDKTNQVLSIKSDDYEIIQDIDVLRRYMDLFDEARIAVEPVRHHVTRSKDGVMGRTTYMEVRLPDFDLMPGTDNHSETRIVITNSNDGTKKNRFYRLHYNLNTRNNTFGWAQDIAFATKHRTGANERLAQSLRNSMGASIEREREIITALAGANTTQEAVLSYINDNPILSGERNAEKLMGAWMQQSTSTNIWRIYNIFAGIITHNYGSNFGTKVDKLAALNQAVKRSWNRIFNVNIPWNNWELEDEVE